MILGVLGFGRRIALATMTDTVRVFTVTRSGDFDPVTGEPIETETEVYVGPGKLVLRSTDVRKVDAAQQLLAVLGPRLDLPVETPEGATGSTGAVGDGHQFEVTASASDSALVGVSGKVSGGFTQTHATARRLPVEVLG